MKRTNRTIKKITLIMLLLQLCVFASAQSNADYTPRDRGDWAVSTPEAEGLDTRDLDQLYAEAEELETLYSLIIIKNGKLVAEQYFNGQNSGSFNEIASTTKSMTSALMGIAIDQGYVEGVDEKMIQYFPEVANRIRDQRKRDITIELLLEMRSGFPWEETDARYWQTVQSFDYVPAILNFPLTADPDTKCQYSNLSSHWLGLIVSRSTGMDLKQFAIDNLFGPMDIPVGVWYADVNNDNFGCFGLALRARDMAKIGQMYLDGGVWNGQRILTEQWVEDSLTSYTDNAWVTRRIGRHFRDIGYGYQWWSAKCGRTEFDFAWGHGGQLIILIQELDMVIVTTAYAFPLQHDGESWHYEKQVIDLVGRYIQKLPASDR